MGRNDKHRIRGGFVWIANWLPVNVLLLSDVFEQALEPVNDGTGAPAGVQVVEIAFVVDVAAGEVFGHVVVSCPGAVQVRVLVLKLDADQEIGQPQAGLQEPFVARGLVCLAGGAGA